MKKLLYVCLLIGSYAAFVSYVQLNATSPVIATPPVNDIAPSAPAIVAPVVSPAPVPVPAPIAVPTPVPTPVPIPAPIKQAGQYKNGSFTGAIADAYYGNVQVRVTVSNGVITNVEFLDHPQDRGRSIEINNYAMPRLISEVIKAQSANVNIISGATATSEAFLQSLGSALSQAQI